MVIHLAIECSWSFEATSQHTTIIPMKGSPQYDQSVNAAANCRVKLIVISSVSFLGHFHDVLQPLECKLLRIEKVGKLFFTNEGKNLKKLRASFK